MKTEILQNDELYHYGVQGMKWGVRRTPEELGHEPVSKKTARQYSKAIAVLDYNRGAAKVNQTRAENDLKKAEKKMAKATGKAYEKAKAKYDLSKDRVDQYSKEYKEGQKAVERYIKSAKSAGYTVSEMKVKETYNDGKSYVRAAMIGALPNILYQTASSDYSTTLDSYRVKAPKK